MATKQYRPWTPDQMYLLPPSPREWLPEGHLAYFILDVVGELDMSAIDGVLQSRDHRGERPYSPTMMTALLLYAYCVGVFSSRRIARGTHEDVAFRVITGDAHPHFTRINQFRLQHRAALAGLFVQVLMLCKKAGLVKLGHVSLDGSKVQANASKHKAMTYARMTEEEKRLQGEVEALLARSETIDKEEDERYGEDNDEQEVPEELRRREARLAKIRAAKTSLEAEAAQARAQTLRNNAADQRDKAADASVDPDECRRATRRAERSEQQARALDGRDGDDDPPTSPGDWQSGVLPHHRVPAQVDGTPKPNAQRCFTDPDSRVMHKGGATVQAYNAQIIVDADSQVIVAEAVTNQAPDVEHLPALIDRAIDNCGQSPERLSADTGYLSEQNVKHCERRGIDAYIGVGRKLDESAQPTPQDGAPSSALLVRQKMRTKLLTSDGKEIYARRKCIAEPPFGQIKEARGFRRFHLRGLDKVRCEWSLLTLTHNLLKLFRAQQATSALASV
jgi:transposase